MEKEGLRILVVNRPLKQGEHPVRDIFQIYKERCDVVIFPWREDKRRTEVVFFGYRFIEAFEDLFTIKIKYGDDDPLFSFDLEDITEEIFYDILYQMFEVKNFYLTDVEAPSSSYLQSWETAGPISTEAASGVAELSSGTVAMKQPDAKGETLSPGPAE